MTLRRAWYLYDWANSAFVTTVMAAVLPPYFARVAAADLPTSEATALWGYATAGWLALAALLSPLVGAAADHFRGHRRVLVGAVAAGVLGTAGLSLVGRGDWPWALVLYGVAFLGFTFGQVIYDGLLLVIAPPAERDRLSSRGFAWGYAGGGLLLAVHALWIAAPERFGFADAGAASRLAFLTVALWWALFSLPLLRNAPAPPAGGERTFASPIARLRETLASPGRLREAWKFLAAFWLYNDGVGTVVKMSTIYGAALGFGTAHLVGALLLVQILGAPAAWLGGRWAERWGARAVVVAGLGVYVGIAVFGFFMSEPLHFWILAGLVSLAQGPVQALSRSLFASLVPEERSGEMYGYYSVSFKLAGLFGPLAFAVITQLTGNPRYGALAIVPFLIAGAALLLTVRLPRSERFHAGDETPLAPRS